MSKYRFKITYRNENEYGQYWDDNGYTVSIIAETLKQAKQKLDDIEKSNYGFHKNILEWEAEEITEDKDKEIERLNNIINGMEEFFKYEFEEEVRPLNSFKVSVWTICLDKLQELKGEDK